MGEKGNWGSQRGGWRITTHYFHCSVSPQAPEPQRSLQQQDALQQLCTGFELKCENLRRLKVRTCFLGGLSAEGRGSKEAPAYLQRQWTSPSPIFRIRKETAREAEAGDRAAAEGKADSAPDQTSQPPPLLSGPAKNSRTLKVHVSTKKGPSLLLLPFLD